MILRFKKSIIPILAIAFAIAALFFFKTRTGSKSEGFGRFKAEAFKAENGWGYRIYERNTVIIEQANIPGMQGNEGFKDKNAALKTGELVQSKLARGIFPPTVTVEELDSLGVTAP